MGLCFLHFPTFNLHLPQLNEMTKLPSVCFSAVHATTTTAHHYCYQKKKENGAEVEEK